MKNIDSIIKQLTEIDQQIDKLRLSAAKLSDMIADELESPQLNETLSKFDDDVQKLNFARKSYPDFIKLFTGEIPFTPYGGGRSMSDNNVPNHTK